MGTILVSAILTKVSRILQDEGNSSWSAAELLGWFNGAEKDIVSIKPSANVSHVNVSLVAGTKQSITGFMLIDVVRNMGTGAIPGASIDLLDRGILDTSVPGWHAYTAAATVLAYCYDVRDPKVFWVFPPQPAATTQVVETIQSVIPTEKSATSQAITIDDIYEGALIEHICYRAFMKDADNPNYITRADKHFKGYLNALGMLTQGESAFTSKTDTTSSSKSDDTSE